MSVYLQILLVTALTGIGGLALGGWLAVLVHNPSDKQMSILLRFTAGIMLSVVCFDLIADARENMGTLTVIGWIAAGYFATYLLNCWVDKHAHHSHNHGHYEKNHYDHCECDACAHDYHHHEETELCACGTHTLHTAGLVLAAAVALHNMPVGMAIGATFAGADHFGVQAGVLAALVIGLHNLPEGMAIAAPMLSGGTAPVRAVGTAAISGVPTILGALIGYSVGEMNPMLLGISLGFAAGAMLYVVFGELLPEAEQFWRHRLSGFSTLLGILLGILLIANGHIHIH
ncbi:MAG: ZIP family metal transporter [Oscillospiraceae bacterium]|nr:ZIP family metal transporter [Oscillospiraceae bacterium]